MIEVKTHELAEKLSKLLYCGDAMFSCVYVAEQISIKPKKGKSFVTPAYPDLKNNQLIHIKYSQDFKKSLYIRPLNDIRKQRGKQLVSGKNIYQVKETNRVRIGFIGKGTCLDVEYIKGQIEKLITDCGHECTNRSASFTQAFEAEFKGQECLPYDNDCLFYIDVELVSIVSTKDGGCPVEPNKCPENKKYKYCMCKVCCCENKKNLGQIDACNLPTEFDTGILLVDRNEYIVKICKDDQIVKTIPPITSTGIGGNLILDFSDIFSDICNSTWCYSMLIEKKNGEGTEKLICYEFEFYRTC